MPVSVGASIQVLMGVWVGNAYKCQHQHYPNSSPTISDGSVSSPVRSLVLHAPRRYEKAVPPAFAGNMVTASL
jgi:hypothetical protein